MNKMLKTSVLILAFVQVFFAIGKGDDLVHFPHGPASWTVDVTPLPGGARLAQGTVIQKIEVTQDEHQRRCIVHWSNGSTRETWMLTGLDVVLTEDPNGHAMLADNTYSFAVAFLPGDFLWLKPEFLQERDPIDYKGKKCLHYKGPSMHPVFSVRGEGDDPVMCEAWIDSKTLLPVALGDATCVGTFTFLKAPEAPLVLPAKFKSKLDRYKLLMANP